MGPLQPRLGSDSKDRKRTVLDLKCDIFIHEVDRPGFAFAVPTFTNKEPLQHSHCTLLPRAMADSPTVCQCFVARPVDPLRKRFPRVYLVRYMDEI